MALTKVNYVDNQTVIGAANLNAIQDEIINKCVTVEAKSFTAAQKTQALTNIGGYSSAGGNLTGDAILQANKSLVLVDSQATTDNTPTVNHAGTGIRFRDSQNNDNYRMGEIQPLYYNNGTMGLQIGGARNINGSLKHNLLQLLIQDNSNFEVRVSDAAAWRKALDLAYYAGQTISTTVFGYGYTTSTSGNLYCCLPFPKVIDATTVQISGVDSTSIRGVNGVIVNAGNDVSKLNIQSCIRSGIGIRFNCNNLTTNWVANTPISIVGTFTIKFT